MKVQPIVPAPVPSPAATTPPAPEPALAEGPNGTVSLRELNQRSGRVVGAVIESGRPVVITDRGRPVAQIVPIHADETPYERLLREGRIRRATRPSGWEEWRRPRRRVPEDVDLMAALMEEREEER